MSDFMQRSAADFFAAKGIIASAFVELSNRGIDPEAFAAAVLARLAHLDPPLLLVRADDIKE